MPDLDEETESYFQAIQGQEGILVSTDMDTEEIIQDILRGMIEVRLADETPERLH